jgi:hypothetical protein
MVIKKQAAMCDLTMTIKYKIFSGLIQAASKCPPNPPLIRYL